MWERSDAYVTKYFIPLQKYEFAVKHLNQTAPRLLVADAACGLGYGTDMIVRAGHPAIGMDVSLEALNYAENKGYRGGHVLTDISRQTFDGFDALVSIETLEHLLDPFVWLKNLRMQWLVISTTVWDGSTAHDEWHKHNFTKDQFRAMLTPKFEILDELHHSDRTSAGLEEYLTLFARNTTNRSSKPA